MAVGLYFSFLLQPAYRCAFDPRTRGYLLRCEEGDEGRKGAGKAIIKAGNWQRYWCVLDGSTLLCYLEEEVCMPVVLCCMLTDCVWEVRTLVVSTGV